MEIKIRTIANDLLVSFTPQPSPSDPLAQRGWIPTSISGALGGATKLMIGPGEIYAHDVTELVGYIAEAVMKEYDK